MGASAIRHLHGMALPGPRDRFTPTGASDGLRARERELVSQRGSGIRTARRFEYRRIKQNVYLVVSCGERDLNCPAVQIPPTDPARTASDGACESTVGWGCAFRSATERPSEPVTSPRERRVGEQIELPEQVRVTGGMKSSRSGARPVSVPLIVNQGSTSSGGSRVSATTCSLIPIELGESGVSEFPGNLGDVVSGEPPSLPHRGRIDARVVRVGHIVPKLTKAIPRHLPVCVLERSADFLCGLRKELGRMFDGVSRRRIGIEYVPALSDIGRDHIGMVQHLVDEKPVSPVGVLHNGTFSAST